MYVLYELRCETCKAVFKPIVSTLPEDLLLPDEDMLPKDSPNGIALREFLKEHRGHDLETVVVP